MVEAEESAIQNVWCMAFGKGIDWHISILCYRRDQIKACNKINEIAHKKQ